ncbi:PD-(D/E)XK nuclease-like domain-containing protein [Salibacterium qingdaonense]|uniref:Putative exodeoxyribonuclease 8 PDDEXK-like domain-containing protein n=1 Tax=Salibacterium qingdaonense TaxID=266892 RepID=A0A1I4QWI3_9BACI|nr:PD-(D/E)XK nuclease-like domain-containing protein [Salibacterium qingdaonense]SFM44357.1 PDDEXK-like protein of unknown function [Salibacterium qingdaonense]
MAMTEQALNLQQTNYHSTDADQQYMSVSQFKNWLDCEARTLAEIKGDYVPPISTPLIVGTYVHAAFENQETFRSIEEQYSDMIFKKNGSKYADFETADRMIDTIKQDDFAMFAMDGEKEKIYTADLFGVPWKIKVDSINHDRKSFTDLKTTQDLYKRYWSKKYEGFTSFVEAWDYVLQMAIYREVIAKNTGEAYTPYIVAATKESPSNKAVLHFEPSRFDFELEYTEAQLEHIMNVKNEEVPPRRCEQCSYCRSTKKLTNTMEIGDLIY